MPSLSIWRRELCRSHAGVPNARSEPLQPLTWSSGHSNRRRPQPKGVPNAHRPQRRAFPTHNVPNARRSQRTPFRLKALCLSLHPTNHLPAFWTHDVLTVKGERLQPFSWHLGRDTLPSKHHTPKFTLKCTTTVDASTRRRETTQRCGLVSGNPKKRPPSRDLQ